MFGWNDLITPRLPLLPMAPATNSHITHIWELLPLPWRPLMAQSQPFAARHNNFMTWVPAPCLGGMVESGSVTLFHFHSCYGCQRSPSEHWTKLIFGSLVQCVFSRQHSGISSSTQSMLWHWFWQPFKVVTVKLHLDPNKPLVAQLWMWPDSQKHNFSIVFIFLWAPINTTRC